MIGESGKRVKTLTLQEDIIKDENSRCILDGFVKENESFSLSHLPYFASKIV